MTAAGLTAKVATGWPPGRRVDRLVLVAGDGPDTLVRLALSSGTAPKWKCGSCGPMDKAECPHTLAAAVALAEAMFGVAVTAIPAHQIPGHPAANQKENRNA